MWVRRVSPYANVPIPFSFLIRRFVTWAWAWAQRPRDENSVLACSGDGHGVLRKMKFMQSAVVIKVYSMKRI